MRYLKLLQIYENDGMTPKRHTSFSYDQLTGSLLQEMKPTEVGSSMLLSRVDDYRSFQTTRVQAIDRDGQDFRVLTRNTIYHFEVVERRRMNKWSGPALCETC
ncbi:hypothetical protein [Paenibacillus sp. FJAT-26967]|uniref:hypothetical protein n=1 Tax=Paenibacillus sp. FJAT-26967 TaxID=1729690 RepID=UPI000838AE07|nr:hypothetical protein [Paenibacillus sp. FJAT-26967]